MNTAACKAITDAKKRAAAAAKEATKHDELADEFRAIRDPAVEELLKAGEKPAEVARIIGVSRGYMTRWKDVRPEVTGA